VIRRPRLFLLDLDLVTDPIVDFFFVRDLLDRSSILFGPSRHTAAAPNTKTERPTRTAAHTFTRPRWDCAVAQIDRIRASAAGIDRAAGTCRASATAAGFIIADAGHPATIDARAVARPISICDSPRRIRSISFSNSSFIAARQTVAARFREPNRDFAVAARLSFTVNPTPVPIVFAFDLFFIVFDPPSIS
jgi:hypothetical protein